MQTPNLALLQVNPNRQTNSVLYRLQTHIRNVNSRSPTSKIHYCLDYSFTQCYTHFLTHVLRLQLLFPTTFNHHKANARGDVTNLKV